jgi:hypothetical protein
MTEEIRAALTAYIQAHLPEFAIAAQRRVDYFAALYARWEAERQ